MIELLLSLKPCPCCNYGAKLCQYSKTYDRHNCTARVKCNRCGVQTPRFSGATADEAAEKAADVWNARADQDCEVEGLILHDKPIESSRCKSCGKEWADCDESDSLYCPGCGAKIVRKE